LKDPSTSQYGAFFYNVALVQICALQVLALIFDLCQIGFMCVGKTHNSGLFYNLFGCAMLLNSLLLDNDINIVTLSTNDSNG